MYCSLRLLDKVRVKKNRAMKKLTARPQLVSIHYLALKQTKQRNKLTNIIYSSCGTHTRTRARARATHDRETRGRGHVDKQRHTTREYCDLSFFFFFFFFIFFSLFVAFCCVTQREVYTRVYNNARKVIYTYILFTHESARIVDMHTHGLNHSENKRKKGKR